MWWTAMQAAWQMKLKEIKLNNLLNDKKSIRKDFLFFFLMDIGADHQALEENES